MTLLDLAIFLRERQIPTELYSIGRLGRSDNVGIMKKGEKWMVFFNERGYPDGVEFFEEEGAAVERFLERLTRHVRDYGGDL